MYSKHKGQNILLTTTIHNRFKDFKIIELPALIDTPLVAKR